MSTSREKGASMNLNKALKGRVDQISAKIGFERVSLLKFCTLHDFAYEAHFSPNRNHIILSVSKS